MKSGRVGPRQRSSRRPPPAGLECPDPAGCPVTPDLPRLTVAEMASGTARYRVYDGTWGDDEHNPGFGDARFSPFDDVGDGHRGFEHVCGGDSGSGAIGDGFPRGAPE